jgi:hypothetical protein
VSVTIFCKLINNVFITKKNQCASCCGQRGLGVWVVLYLIYAGEPFGIINGFPSIAIVK